MANQTHIYTTVSSKLLDLFSILKRGLSSETINKHIFDIFANGLVQDKIDIFVLAFQTRDIRGGRGERSLFDDMIKSLSKLKLDVVKSIIHLIPEYGSWQDLLYYRKNGKLPEVIQKLIFKQIDKDELTPDGQPISLLAKWLPREHSNIVWHKTLAKNLAQCLYPDDPKAQEKYRKRISALNKRLNTVEIDMCNNNFASIEPSKVPNLALKKYSKAFLNKPIIAYREYNRPNQELDRIICCQNFTDYFTIKNRYQDKVNVSKTLYLHNIIHNILNTTDMQQDEIYNLTYLWDVLSTPIKNSGVLSKTIGMCDFSYSMNDMTNNINNPMDISIALSLIISQCNTGIFADSLLTFDSNPTIYNFKSSDIIKRVNEIRNLSQCPTVNFQEVHNVILEKLQELKVAPGQEPKNLIVSTDMRLEQTCEHNIYEETHNSARKETDIQIARRNFKLVGDQLFGEGMGWKPPQIVIWNLRTENKGFNVETLEEGVVQISGCSRSILRLITKYGLESLTLDKFLRTQLDDPRYDPVRDIVKSLLD
jgi:hypothetical protein